jgi:hypothetical protein
LQAKKVLELLAKKREQDAIARGHEQTAANRVSLIDDIVLIDRWVDPITPLITQLTYEGLIDELFGVRYGASPTN